MFGETRKIPNEARKGDSGNAHLPMSTAFFLQVFLTPRIRER
jgi:hypothetical protein